MGGGLGKGRGGVWDWSGYVLAAALNGHAEGCVDYLDATVILIRYIVKVENVSHACLPALCLVRLVDG